MGTGVRFDVELRGHRVKAVPVTFEFIPGKAPAATGADVCPLAAAVKARPPRTSSDELPIRGKLPVLPGPRRHAEQQKRCVVAVVEAVTTDLVVLSSSGELAQCRKMPEVPASSKKINTPRRSTRAQHGK